MPNSQTLTSEMCCIKIIGALTLPHTTWVETVLHFLPMSRRLGTAGFKGPLIEATNPGMLIQQKASLFFDKCSFTKLN